MLRTALKEQKITLNAAASGVSVYLAEGERDGGGGRGRGREWVREKETEKENQRPTDRDIMKEMDRDSE